jgi:hypothetical protein
MAKLLLSVLLLPAAVFASETYPADVFLDPEHVMIGDEILQVAPAAIEASQGQETEAGFVQTDVLPWPGGVVPLVFSAEGGALTPDQERQVFAACAQWSRRANVRCVRRKNEQVFLTVYKGANCSAFVGYNAGSGWLKMSLKEPGCWRQGTIIHEFGHVLGVRHEQCRPDRDKYITIHWDNIIKQNSFNYAYKQFPMRTSTPYDFQSIMHYPPHGFSSNGRDTFSLNKGYEKYRGMMGQRNGLSELDGQNMAAFYGKPAGGNLTLASADDDQSDASADAGGEDALLDAASYEEAAADASPAAPRLASYAWMLQLSGDERYAAWRKSADASLSKAARSWLPATRRGAIARAYAAAVAAVSAKAAKGCPAAAELKSRHPKLAGPALPDAELKLSAWGHQIWPAKLTPADRARSKPISEAHAKALRLAETGGEAGLCEAAGIYASLAAPHVGSASADADADLQADDDEAPAGTPAAGVSGADVSEHDQIAGEAATHVARERAKRAAEEAAKKKGKR